MTVLHTQTSKFPGPEIKINCPKCGPSVPASTYRLEEKVGVDFVPLMTQRETYVECTQCGTARLTKLTFDELAVCPPDELDRHLYYRISLIIKVMALASVVACCIPFVSLGFGVIGFLATKRKGGWVKVVSLIGIVLGVLINLSFIAAMLMEK